jgi:hypothetical protein
MLRSLIVAALASAGCGRIGYDPVGDGGDGLAIDPPARPSTCRRRCS